MDHIDESWRFLDALFCPELSKYIEQVCTKIFFKSPIRSGTVCEFVETLSSKLLNSGGSIISYPEVIKRYLDEDNAGDFYEPGHNEVYFLESRFLFSAGYTIAFYRGETPQVSIQDFAYTYWLWSIVCRSYGIPWASWMIFPCPFKETPRAHRPMLMRRKWRIEILILLLIILRREYEHASNNTNQYLKIFQWKIYEIERCKTALAQPSRLLSDNDIRNRIDDPTKLSDIILFLYKSIGTDRPELLDEDIIAESESLPNSLRDNLNILLPNILEQIRQKIFTPENGRFLIFNNINSVPEETRLRYRDTETNYSSHCGIGEQHRLLVDFLFPYNIVHRNDVFILEDPIGAYNNTADNADVVSEKKRILLNRIYIRLSGGDYKTQYIRWEDLPETKFDYIQLDTLKNGFSPQVIFKRYSKTFGRDVSFLEVRSRYDYDLAKGIADAFRDYRHGMKTERTNIPLIIDSLAKLKSNDDKALRKIKRLRSLYAYQNSLLEIQGKMSSFDGKREEIDITNFVDEYITYYNEIKKIANVYSSVSSSIPMRAYSNKTALWIIFQAVIDNAEKHGFGLSPQKDRIICIEIDSVDRSVLEVGENNKYVRISFCNNGRPLNISLAEFKTRNAFAGPTGNTGIGGYQINQMAEKYGGFIDIPSHKDSRYNKWNTIIEIYLKQDE